jgi:D-alanyl-D-alanine carboxypeptidase/D-alanyl-D-alanine-endopeptidase (penicillin-binding protein 4)
MSSRSSAPIVALALSAVLSTSFSAQSPVPAPSRAVTQLQHDINAILASPQLDRGFWGVLIKPVDRDETWYSRDANKLMMPASSLKVVTLAAAAEKLGWDYRYETKVFAVGTTGGGVLRGDLVVVGSGDPSLDDWAGDATRLFGDWAAQLKAAGITAIDGRIVGDDNAFDDETSGLGWTMDDVATGFAAGVGALQFNEGNVQLRIGPGDAIGDKAIVTVAPGSGGLIVNNLIVTGPPNSAGAVTRRRRPGSSRIELTGTLPFRGRPFALNVSVENPTLYFVTALRDALIADGITVRGQAVDIDDVSPAPSHDGIVPLISYQSPPLSVLATTMMKLSQNQYAEALLKTIGSGTAKGGSATVRTTLQSWNIDPAGVVQVDGSGLSRYDYITPEAMVAVLAHVGRSERLRAIYESTLPIAGRDGTIELRMKGTAAEGKALVKTGSMTGVRTAAGYVSTADGQMLAFAIFANNFDNSAVVINATTDAVIVRLAAFRSR